MKPPEGTRPEDYEEAKKKAEKKKNIELSLGKKSKGDEWTGRVLDIVKRVNNNTNTVIVKMNDEIEAVKKQNTDLQKDLDKKVEDLKTQIDTLKEQNSSILTLLREMAR